MRLHKALYLLFLLLYFKTGNCQIKGLNLKDTVFYGTDWKKTKPQLAKYYREPLLPINDLYKAVYRRVDNTLLSAEYLMPGIVGADSSMEPIYVVNHGEYSEYWRNGKVKANGGYANGKKVGDWNYYYDSGSLKCTENYYDAQPAAYKTLYYENGDKKAEGLMVRVAYEKDTVLQEYGQWYTINTEKEEFQL